MSVLLTTKAAVYGRYRGLSTARARDCWPREARSHWLSCHRQPNSSVLQICKSMHYHKFVQHLIVYAPYSSTKQEPSYISRVIFLFGVSASPAKGRIGVRYYCSYSERDNKLHGNLLKFDTALTTRQRNGGDDMTCPFFSPQGGGRGPQEATTMTKRGRTV